MLRLYGNILYFPFPISPWGKVPGGRIGAGRNNSIINIHLYTKKGPPSGGPFNNLVFDLMRKIYYASLFFCVRRETITSVRKLSGIAIIPGLSRGIGATAVVL